MKRYHGKKEYVRICRNYHAQFEDNFKLKVGYIYGRIWSETKQEYIFFVSTEYNETKDGKKRVWLKIGGEKWHKENISTNSRIGKMIADCVEKNGAPVVESYNRPRKKPKRECSEFNGKKYYECPLENVLPSTKGLRVNKEFDAPRKRPEFVQYSLDYHGKVVLFYKYSDAEKFCDKNGINKNNIRQDFVYDNGSTIHNDYAYWEIFVDMRRIEG